MVPLGDRRLLLKSLQWQELFDLDEYRFEKTSFELGYGKCKTKSGFGLCSFMYIIKVRMFCAWIQLWFYGGVCHMMFHLLFLFVCPLVHFHVLVGVNSKKMQVSRSARGSSRSWTSITYISIVYTFGCDHWLPVITFMALIRKRCELAVRRRAHRVPGPR